MSGAGNTTAVDSSNAPDNCPPQYTLTVELESGTRYVCQFDGVIAVTIDGTPWSRTWWSSTGDAVTEFLPAAKASLGWWNPRYDRDYAAWARSRVAPESCTVC